MNTIPVDDVRYTILLYYFVVEMGIMAISLPNNWLFGAILVGFIGALTIFVFCILDFFYGE